MYLKKTQKGDDIMNKLKLEIVMKVYGDTGTSLAKHLGIARSTFSAKINERNGAEFTKSEMGKIKKKYSLTAEEMDKIFFEQKVS